MPQIFETIVRVKYADTDKMQVVYYGRYFEYFEIGRNELLRQMGYEYTRLEKDGFILPVIEAHSNYYAPATYDDVVIIRSKIDSYENVRIKISHEIIHTQTEKILVAGYTIHAFVKNETRKPARPPQELIDKILFVL